MVEMIRYVIRHTQDDHAGRQRRGAFDWPVIDQAALHGLLKKVQHIGMPPVSIIHVEPGQADTSEIKL